MSAKSSCYRLGHTRLICLGKPEREAAMDLLEGRGWPKTCGAIEMQRSKGAFPETSSDDVAAPSLKEADVPRSMQGSDNAAIARAKQLSLNEPADRWMRGVHQRLCAASGATTSGFAREEIRAAPSKSTGRRNGQRLRLGSPISGLCSRRAKGHVKERQRGQSFGS